MIHLASRPEGTFVSRAVLAKEAEAPESFLSKILQALARAGMIEARRGVVGGFSLLPRGKRASLLEVVESIDGPIALNICVTSGASCHRHAKCAAHGVWLRAQAAMLSVLREAKIAEMVPAGESCRTLLHIAQVSGSGKHPVKQASPQGALPRKPRTTTRTPNVPSGARRIVSKKKI